MIVVTFLFSIVFLVAMGFTAWSEPKLDKHAICLRNIERIERDLWPERFEEIQQFGIGPGEVWQVNGPGHIALMSDLQTVTGRQGLTSSAYRRKAESMMFYGIPGGVGPG